MVKKGSSLLALDSWLSALWCYALNVIKIQNKLGWRPLIPLGEGLGGTISWYQNHRAWWERIKSGEYRDYYQQWHGEGT